MSTIGFIEIVDGEELGCQPPRGAGSKSQAGITNSEVSESDLPQHRGDKTDNMQMRHEYVDRS